MKTFKIIKKIVSTGEVVVLGTIKAKTVKEARKVAVAEYLGQVDMTAEQLIVTQA